MGTIPAPNIAEGIQGPQNAFAEYARGAALQTQAAAMQQQAQQQAQMAPIQQQAAQEQLTAMQMQNQQTQAVNQAYQGAFKPGPNGGAPQLDTDTLQQKLAETGHGAAIPNIMEGLMKYKAAQGAVQEQQQKLQITSQDMMGNLGYSLAQANYDPQLAHTIIQDHLNDPTLTPQVRGQLQQLQQQIVQNPGLIKQSADQWMAQSPAQQGRIQELAKGRLENAQAAHEEFVNSLTKNSKPGDFDTQIDAVVPPTGPQGQAENQFVKAQVNGFLSRGDLPNAQHALEQAYQNQLEVQKEINPQVQAGKVQVAQNTAAAVMKVQAGGVPAVGAVAAVAQGVTDPKALQAAVPDNIRPTVTAVLEGRQTPPGGFALKAPYWQNVMNQVYALDPQWNEQRAQLRKAYTVGPQSKEINSINTAMGHLGVLSDSIDALNNSDVQGLNRIANFLGVQIGNTPVTTFNTIVHRVGPEIATAYIGAGGSAGERGSDEKDFATALGPAQLKSNSGITAQLLRSKISSLENQWNQNAAPGISSFQDRFITPEAQRALNRLAPLGAGGAGVGAATNAPPGSAQSGAFSWDAMPKH